MVEFQSSILKGLSQAIKVIKLDYFSPIYRWVDWSPEPTVTFLAQNGQMDWWELILTYLSDFQSPLHLMLYQFVPNQLLSKCSRFTFANVLLFQLDNKLLHVTICICSALAPPSTLLITSVSLVPTTTTTTHRTRPTWANSISIHDLNTNCSIFSELPYI